MLKSKRPHKDRLLRGLTVVMAGVFVFMLSMVGPVIALGQSVNEMHLGRYGGVVNAPVNEVLAAPRADATPPSHSIWLPLIAKAPTSSYRLGFGLTSGSLSQYPEAASLKAGWYVDWNVRIKPQRPNNMEYVQMVRLHQTLTCPLFSADAWNRASCPYAVPHSYSFSPSADTIVQAAKANPGSLWLIGNEMDRRDWPGGGQDEMLPELYATAYHELYTLIKGVDPKAQIAIGGVIQATPLRLEYLTKAWNAYQQRYGSPMPVDVWNVHNFILKEDINDYGASIPPGSTAQTGVLYPTEVGGDNTHVSMTIFDQQIRAFRAWMKDRGQQNKPLIVSEYGVLYQHITAADTPEEVQDFMLKTFDYFLNTRDCNLGYPADGCRLVQRWAWYSFNDDGTLFGFNPHGNFFNPKTYQITSTGVRFREYSLANLMALQ